jgi:hypothetical protein
MRGRRRFLYDARVSDPKNEEPKEEPRPSEPAKPAVSPGLLAVLAVVLIWGLFFVTGLGGLEFGEHWDEGRLLGSFAHAWGTGSLRPTFYVYPSVTHWLFWLPGLPSFLSGFPAAKQCLGTVDALEPTAWTPCLEHWTEHAIASIEPKVMLLRARFVFLVISSIGVALTGLAAWRHRRRAGEVAIAAGVVGLSWEVQYHARWTAPDAILMTAAALTMLLLHEAERRASPRWLTAAAAAAALGAGMKLTGGILLLPVLIVGASTPRAGRLLPSIDGRKALRLAASFAIAFCLISPGVLVDMPQVVLEMLHEARHYATGHGAYTTRPGPLHLARMLVYVLGPLLSPRWPLGFVLGALALAGAYAAWRDEQRTVRAFLVTAAVFLLYMAMQRVMIVRNLIWLAPLLGTCAARGVTFLGERIAERLPRSAAMGPAVIAGLLLAMNAAFLADASARIPERKVDGHPARAVAIMLERPSLRFFLTAAARARFAAAGAPVQPNVVARAEDADYVLGLFSELPADGVPANEPGTFALGLTAPEINLDYYPTSLDRERFVALRARTWITATAASAASP